MIIATPIYQFQGDVLSFSVSQCAMIAIHRHPRWSKFRGPYKVRVHEQDCSIRTNLDCLRHNLLLENKLAHLNRQIS